MKKIGVVGLGTMGLIVAKRLLQAGFVVYGFDINVRAIQHAQQQEIIVVPSLGDLADVVDAVWLMVPAGAIIDDIIKQLHPYMKKYSVIIDGGNSKFTDSIRRSQELEAHQISFLDCGTSGGVKGEQLGFSLMIGGDKKVFEQAEPIFKALAALKAYALVGSAGAGHYVKMIHNGIEYALLQSYAEGFELLKEGRYKNLDLAQITTVWSKAAIIRSYILELSHEIFMHDQALTNIEGSVEETGMGQWTVDEAHAQKVQVPMIEQALKIRAWSRATGGNYATKIVALLRNAFGKHPVKTN